jgi:two-component system cell cycle response regulator
MRVLIAEDERGARRLLEARLSQWGYEVTGVADGGQAWEQLRGETPPPLAILDWVMPGMDGPEVCRRVRALRREPYIYLILLTSNDQKADMVRGMEAGADDYLTKPWDAHELEVRVRAGRRIVELQSQLIAAREELRREATHDSLTGLWSRAAVLGILAREVHQARREGAPLALVMVDIDRFKSVNDTYGHLVGDAVLREVAHRVESRVRGGDIVGRYGGEEFVVVLPGCDGRSAVEVAERLRSAVADAPVERAPGPLRVTVSLGVAAEHGDGDLAADPLLRAADEALYRAKAEGRNRTVLWVAQADPVGV